MNFKIAQNILNVNELLVYINSVFFKKESIYENFEVSNLKQLPRRTIQGLLYKLLSPNIGQVYKSIDLIYSFTSTINFSVDSLCSLQDFQFVYGSKPSFDNNLKKIVYDDKGIYDLRTSERIINIVCTRTSSYFYNNENVLILIDNKSKFSAYTLPSAQPLWQFSLAGLGTYRYHNNETRAVEVSQFIGVYDHVLWVFLSPGWILGLDIITGEQKQLLKGVPRDQLIGTIDEYLEETDLLRFVDTHYVLDHATGIIHGLIYDKHYQIDVSSEVPSNTIWGMQAAFKEIGIGPGSIDRRFALFEGKIYFAAYEQGRFGILNTTAKTIDYVSEQFTEQWLKDIQVNEQNVYVLDENGTLFIFEKEENKET